MHTLINARGFASAAVLSALAVVLGACAGGPQPDAGAGLLDREQAWADAMSAHDSDVLDEILAPEYRLTYVPDLGFPGKPEVTREMWLENLEVMTFGPITMSQQRVTMCGDNIAVVEMQMTLEQWQAAGQTLPPNYHLADIWVRRDGRWQVVNRISEPLDPPTPLPGPPPPADGPPAGG
ncbi:MAG: nuclear transport factor 2 family protein [Phycisphaerales bacterium JB039]